MAKLLSEEKNCPSRLEITAGPTMNLENKGQTESWQKVRILLVSGNSSIASIEGDNCSLCRKPSDEIEKLTRQLDDLLHGKIKGFVFEPNEPAFELSFSSSHHDGIKIEAWIDAGNGRTGFYTWDAAGIRFFTTLEALKDFMEQLNGEFNDSLDNET